MFQKNIVKKRAGDINVCLGLRHHRHDFHRRNFRHRRQSRHVTDWSKRDGSTMSYSWNYGSNYWMSCDAGWRSLRLSHCFYHGCRQRCRGGCSLEHWEYILRYLWVMTDEWLRDMLLSRCIRCGHGPCYLDARSLNRNLWNYLRQPTRDAG